MQAGSRGIEAPLVCAASVLLLAATGALCASAARAMDMPPGMKMPGMNMSSDAGVNQSRTVGAYHLELHVLPPEPFFSADEVAARHLTAGMLVTGGAAPISPTASPAPNHHLVVHIADSKSGQTVTDARVTLDLQALDASGKSTGPTVSVPVVVMQAIGAGATSTHYGNNVVLDPGSYRVTVTVNGTAATFHIKV